MTAKELRRFGQTIGLAFGLLALLLVMRGHSFGLFFLIPSLALVLLGFFAPVTLGPVYNAWMKIAKALGAIIAPIILTIVYYIVMTPIALLARLLSKKFIDTAIDQSLTTYWRKREEESENYERQF